MLCWPATRVHWSACTRLWGCQCITITSRSNFPSISSMVLYTSPGCRGFAAIVPSTNSSDRAIAIALPWSRMAATKVLMALTVSGLGWTAVRRASSNPRLLRRVLKELRRSGGDFLPGFTVEYESSDDQIEVAVRESSSTETFPWTLRCFPRRRGEMAPSQIELPARLRGARTGARLAQHVLECSRRAGVERVSFQADLVGRRIWAHQAIDLCIDLRWDIRESLSLAQLVNEGVADWMSFGGSTAEMAVLFERLGLEEGVAKVPENLSRRLIDLTVGPQWFVRTFRARETVPVTKVMDGPHNWTLGEVILSAGSGALPLCVHLTTTT